MTPSIVQWPGGRSHRGGFLALLAAIVLAAPLVPAAAALSPTTATGTPSSAQADGSALVSPAAGQVDGTRVTLVTGDVVTYREQDGESAVSVEAAARADGRPVTFVTEGDADAFYVYPSDVQAQVHEGRLDRELFNVAGLVRQGLDDATTGGELPLIVTFDQDRSPAQLDRNADALPAADDAEALETVNGAAVALDSGKVAEFREAVLSEPEQGSRANSSHGLDGVVDKVWLDSVLEIDLDESVPQIGAPAAWDAGYTGEGVTVAVLDTGVDTSHPDLAGQVVAAEDFTGEGDTSDVHGHGTHVASTIAGTGAASGGQYTGVAPDADLLSGRVCNAEGKCQESDIIEAMEWATDQDADIVNMSLGGAPTDGTDPVSQTLNQLSAGTDTLFVVSAGNNGPSSFTVGSPGSADAALTVAAVDRFDRTAGFSSHGPRVGNFAVKPNITAPGVDIVAARAAGTAMGAPVGDHYTTASGTSMAAPHVAGAAALLAQAKPDVSASALKDALASTSTDIGENVWSQGAGRVDVAAALTHDVYGPASADFGSLTDEPARREVVYTNHDDTPITLELAATLTTWRGDPADGLTLAADTVTVPAHGQASVIATVSPETTGQGVFEGFITATADGVALRTAVGFGSHAGGHTLTVNVLDSEGNPYKAPTGGSARKLRVINDTFNSGSGVGRRITTLLIDENGVATGQGN